MDEAEPVNKKARLNDDIDNNDTAITDLRDHERSLPATLPQLEKQQKGIMAKNSTSGRWTSVNKQKPAKKPLFQMRITKTWSQSRGNLNIMAVPVADPMYSNIPNLKAKFPDAILILHEDGKHLVLGESIVGMEFGASTMIPDVVLKFCCDYIEQGSQLGTGLLWVELSKDLTREMVEDSIRLGREVVVLTPSESNSSSKVWPYIRQYDAKLSGPATIDFDDQGVYLSDVTPSHDHESFGLKKFIMCVTETDATRDGTAEQVQIVIVAISPTTGQVVYDEFKDTVMRHELDTRVLHLEPCHIMIIGDMSAASRQVIDHYRARYQEHSDSRIALNLMDYPALIPQDQMPTIKAIKSSLRAQANIDRMIEKGSAQEDVEEHHFGPGDQSDIDQTSPPSRYDACFLRMVKCLDSSHLTGWLPSQFEYISFQSISTMVINATALKGLELLQNQTTFTKTGSLFGLLDHNFTTSGRKLLRDWIVRPLRKSTDIEQRLDAVQEFASILGDDRDDVAILETIRFLGSSKLNLDLILMQTVFKRCGRRQFLRFLQALDKVASLLHDNETVNSNGPNTTILKEQIACMSGIRKIVSNILIEINTNFTESIDQTHDYLTYLKEEYKTTAMQDCEHHLEVIERRAQDNILLFGKLFQSPIDLKNYADLGYLVSICDRERTQVPKDWEMVPSSSLDLEKGHILFRPLLFEDLSRQMFHWQATLLEACDAAFSDQLGEISRNIHMFRRCIRAIATVDCLQSLAQVAVLEGYHRPELCIERQIEIIAGRHPVLEQLSKDASTKRKKNKFHSQPGCVPNDVHLDANSTRAILLTGPNMGGKTTHARLLVLIIIMIQIGSFVPAKSAKSGLFDKIFFRIGSRDDPSKGQSSLTVELSETLEILTSATKHSLVIVDELGCSTSVQDGSIIAQSVLEYLIEEVECFLVFTTHYLDIGKKIQAVATRNMLVHKFMTFQRDSKDPRRVRFNYKVADGVAEESFGLNVALLAGLPPSIIQSAEQAAREHRESQRIQEAKALESSKLQDTISLSRSLLERVRDCSTNNAAEDVLDDEVMQDIKDLVRRIRAL